MQCFVGVEGGGGTIPVGLELAMAQAGQNLFGLAFKAGPAIQIGLGS